MILPLTVSVLWRAKSWSSLVKEESLAYQITSTVINKLVFLNKIKRLPYKKMGKLSGKPMTPLLIPKELHG